MVVFLRKLLALSALFAILLALLVGATWWSIRSTWFAALVKRQILAQLQRTTGGQVTLQSFNFDPNKLTAEISGLVIRGTESPSSPPLLSIASIKLSLRILSVWRQSVDLESLSLVEPRIHIEIHPDGTTNIPPRTQRRTDQPVQQLLDLKIRRLQLTQGLFQVDNRQIPLTFVSNNTSLAISYNYDGPAYAFSIQSSSVALATRSTSLPPIEIDAAGKLFADRAEIAKLELVTLSASSKLAGSGSIQHFAQPVADFQTEALLSVDDLARLGKIDDQLKGGRATLHGRAHFDGKSKQFLFQGQASVLDVDYVSPGFTLRNITTRADLVANNQGILLHRIEAMARHAHFSGEGTIRSYQNLEVQGHVSQVSLHDVGSYLTTQRFPWSATGHGFAHASARLMENEHDFVIGAKVDLDQGTNGIPTSGTIDVTFHARTNQVTFGESTIQLPHSSINLLGSLKDDVAIKAETTNLADLEPLVPIIGGNFDARSLPTLKQGGTAHFLGTLHNVIRLPNISGNLDLTSFEHRSVPWDSFNGQFSLSSSDLSVQHFELVGEGAKLSGSASAKPLSWSFGDNTEFALNARLSDLNVVRTIALILPGTRIPVIQGIASGRVNLRGSFNQPRGDGRFQILNLDAYGEQLNQIQVNAYLDGDRLQLERGRVQSGPALLLFSGSFRRSRSDWSTGDVELKADTNGFPLSSLATVRKYVPAVSARAEAHLDVAGKLLSDSFEPLRLNGSAVFQQIAVKGRQLGNASVHAATQGNSIEFGYGGDLRDTKFSGSATAQLINGTPVKGNVQLDRIDLATLRSLVAASNLTLPVDGFFNGSATYEGLLEDPARLHAYVTIKTLQLNSVVKPPTSNGAALPDIVLRNNEPILLSVSSGVLNISKFELDGRETSVNISGSAPFLNGRPVEIKAFGKADLALFQLFDPNVRSSGASELAVNIAGPVTAMNVNGTLNVRNGSFFLADIPNGLSDVNGTVLFSRNRATIQKMTAHSGGGDISLGGSIAFSEASALVYHLEAEARNVRVRYGNSISVTANSQLRLSGSSGNSLLSGNLTVTRVVFTPNADAGSLLAAASSAAPANPDQSDFIGGLHLDVGVESAPNLQISTNLSRDVEAEIQLRLRGTPEHPVVLGNINANQGDIKIFGTRFSLNRGEVSFVNTVRVEPVLDLDLETQTRGVTVDITVSGTPSKLNFNYRSDPPLQPRDIIALLTVGRAPGVATASNAQGGSDASALSSGVTSVLGQAISPVSNRLSKLFGITNIRIDPFVQGVTNTPQARLSVEQQISRNVTVTYVTNLSQTSEQIFRFEWALNRQFSVVAIRDDNGEFGIDFQYKKRFK